MRNVISIIGTVLFGWITWYFAMPTFSWGFFDWAFWLLLTSLLFVGLSVTVGEDFSNTRHDKPSPAAIGGIVVAIFCVIMLTIVPMFGTWSLFHSTAYRNLVGNVETKENNTIMSPIDPSNIVIIDDQTAHRLADKVLGSSDLALGSESYIGELTLQKVGTKLYYVAPLLHSGFFKWISNGDRGTKGYVMVNATNDKDVKLVQNVGGKPVSIIYQPESYFSQNLERHLYRNGFMTRGFTDFSFEVDDSLNPFYVATIYDNTIGYSGRDVIGVATVDVKTGEIKEYSTKDAPVWVDRIYPSDFIESQVDDWGYYVHGWLNPSDKDRIVSTEGISIVYGDDGKCYFYTGITSVGKDESSIGFMLIDSREKTVHYYKQSGATEKAAMQSAEGKVQEKGYVSTHPRPYNVDGVWSYVMALKDKEGLIKSVAIVSVSNYDIVGVGDDIKSAIRNFKSAMNSSGNVMATTTKGESFLVKDVLSRVSTDVRNGNTYFYMLLKKNQDKIFVSTSAVSEELPLSLVGDSVYISFDDAGGSYIDIRSFDNLVLNPKKTKDQENVEKYFKKVNDSIGGRELDKNTNAIFDTMSVKTKQELLKKMKSK